MNDLLRTIRTLGAVLWHLLGRWLRVAALLTGAFTLLLVVLACTRVPFDAHRWLGTAAGECRAPTDAIVVLGGSGMPSGPEMLRLRRAADLFEQQADATVIVLHPGPPSDIDAMQNELLLGGVPTSSIVLLNQGNNTREQAQVLGQYLDMGSTVALVTAPENMYRSVRVFSKVGFKQVCGAPAWDHAMFHEFDYAHDRIGGKTWSPDVSGMPGLRYTFWNYLKLEITCLREYVAISYYWLNDWI